MENYVLRLRRRRGASPSPLPLDERTNNNLLTTALLDCN